MSEKFENIIITICAFMDTQPNSVAYKKFDNIEDAVKFYKKMIEKPYVNVISTRKINQKLYFKNYETKT